MLETMWTGAVTVVGVALIVFVGGYVIGAVTYLLSCSVGHDTFDTEFLWDVGPVWFIGFFVALMIFSCLSAIYGIGTVVILLVASG